jgi:putative endonuclease
MLRKQFYIYIVSNKYHTVFYTGVCNDLIRRVYEHKNKLVEGFTKRYNINQLLYYECTDNPGSAITREKQIKDYRRSKKLNLILAMNGQMKDLYSDLIDEKSGDLSALRASR